MFGSLSIRKSALRGKEAHVPGHFSYFADDCDAISENP
jgi:hypothetical protein